jgi:CheY-like chemotaxis protein
VYRTGFGGQSAVATVSHFATKSDKAMSKVPYEIVLVEDTEPDVFLVREALTQGGLEFDLRVLDDGEKAVEFIENIDSDESVRRPHLVLLDLNLPKKSGGQVLERLRQSPRCGHIPVVILTTSDSPKDRAQTARLGATQFFRKPSRLDDFFKLGLLVRELLTPQPGG